MYFIRGLRHIPPQLRTCVATIGNFDGVHLGHQALLAKLNAQAAHLNLPSVVILFEPQPQEYFAGDSPKPRLTTLKEKLQLLKQFKIDAVLCLRFNRELAEWDAAHFMNTVLKQALDVRYLLIGDDFHFGHDRHGNFLTLKEFGNTHQMTVSNMETIQSHGLRVSSTLVRQVLSDANFELAQSLLGRPFSICGKVIHGDKRGRQLGFPTANVALKRRVSPLHGVYAVKVSGVGEGELEAIANIGVRPTLDGKRLSLEVHIFNFEQNIYHQQLCVTFLKKIREEKRFNSIEELKNQIAADVRETQQFFKINF